MTLGRGATLGDRVKLGLGVNLGNNVTLGDGVKLGDWVWLGEGVKLGDWVRLGDWVTLGNDGLSFAFSPLQIQGSRHLLYVAGPSVIGIGCERHSAEWWLENYESEGRENGYTDAQIAEYKHWLDAAIEWQKTLKKE